MASQVSNGSQILITGSCSESDCISGYASNVFPGKAQQKTEVCKLVKESRFIPEEFVASEVEWLYTSMGIDDLYFQLEDPEMIARHVISLYGTKILSYTKNDNTLDIHFERETDVDSVYINSSPPGVSTETGSYHEFLIDRKYLDNSHPQCAYRVESYRSIPIPQNNFSLKVRSYFVKKCKFVCEAPSEAAKRDIKQVGDAGFLEKATESTLKFYSDIMNKALDRTGPVIESCDIAGSTVKRLAIAYKQGTAKGFFSSLSDLYHYYELYSLRKYVEQFSNGITIICMYLDRTPGVTVSLPIENAIYQIIREVSLLYCLPETPFKEFFRDGTMSAQEVRYAYVGWIFAQHFLNKLGSEYYSLRNMINSEDPAQIEVLQSIKNRLRTDSFSPEFILEIMKKYPNLIKFLYINFAFTHYISPSNSSKSRVNPTLSYQRMESIPVMSEDELLKMIRNKVDSNQELMIFLSLLTFNRHVLKTNFYQPTKVALSFRLNPAFLPNKEYPLIPYGIILVVGNEFRGFHVRFEDVGRGGIRLLTSTSKEVHAINARNLFEENYNLALTQHRKNKDIPEGGSKGAILLNHDQQNRSVVAFEKYVDAIFDLLIVGKTPGIKEKIVDLHNKVELLFFGPDEGTADLMDWACIHARDRGSPFWRSFSTGKSQHLGGIPHDKYGMTTRSIRQFVLGIFSKFNLKEEDCTKIQTGGPDGDLGSNEILLSKAKTIAVIDGSGVIYDPDGLNREELVRLAKKRLTIMHFDAGKYLGKKGFKVLVEDTDLTLPDGYVVNSGYRFRNEFHLSNWARADLFVPCGGRPESISAINVHKMFDEDKKPKFKYIVEGANLFLTQDARLVLEKAGVIIFKDASANKGGVTSSSLEVLAAMVFDDNAYEENMCVKDGKIPQFYNDYVQVVQETIQKNAMLEFEAIWREATLTNTPKCKLTDIISNAIIKLTTELKTFKLWDDCKIRDRILRAAIPKILVDKIGLEKIVERLPENYMRAIISTFIAGRFIYERGPNSSGLAFMEFMTQYQN